MSPATWPVRPSLSSKPVHDDSVDVDVMQAADPALIRVATEVTGTGRADQKVTEGSRAVVSLCPGQRRGPGP